MPQPSTNDRGVYLRTLPSGQKKWYIRFAWHGRDIKRVGGHTKSEARAKLHAILTDLRRGTKQVKHTCTDSLATTIERYEPFAQQLRNFSKTRCFRTFWTERLGPMPMIKITATHIEQAQTALLEAGRSPSTTNRYTDWLRHLLNREVRKGRLPFNPVTRITRLKEPDAPMYHYSTQQETALMKAMGPYGSWVRLAILTGLRQREQFSLRKDWINWEEGVILVPTTKTKPRIVIMTKEIQAIIKALSADHPDSPYLFPSPRDPQRSRDPEAFYRKIFCPAREQAKLPPTLKWHTLRHTFGSRLAEAGASSPQIRELGGWLTEKAANRYIHNRKSHLLEVAERLSQNTQTGTLTGTRPKRRKAKNISV